MLIPTRYIHQRETQKILIVSRLPALCLFLFFSLGAKIKGEKLKPLNHSKAKAIPVPSSLSSLCRTLGGREGETGERVLRT